MVRHQFAVIALAALALGSGFWLLLDLIAVYSRNTETFGVAAFENRYSEFRKTITPHSVFGYISDNPANDPSNLAEYYLTQYTLAPAIIKASSDEQLVVMNFHSNSPDRALLRSKHLAPIQAFGNGVLLCRRVAQ